MNALQAFGIVGAARQGSFTPTGRPILCKVYLSSMAELCSKNQNTFYRRIAIQEFKALKEGDAVSLALCRRLKGNHASRITHRVLKHVHSVGHGDGDDGSV